MIKVDAKKLQKVELQYEAIAKEILSKRSMTQNDKALSLLNDRRAVEHGKIDIQTEFFKELKQKTMSKFELEHRDAEALKGASKKEKGKDDIIKSAKKQGISSVENVEKTVDAKVKKATDDKDSPVTGQGDDSVEQEELKSEVLKAIYENALEEYYSLKLKVNNELIKHGQMNPSSKIYNDYLLYQNYLRKIDESYKVMNGRYIAIDDADIRKKETSYLRKDMQGEYKMQKDIGNVIDRIDKIQDEIEDLDEKIIELNEEFMSGAISSDKYAERLDGLEQELMTKNNELEILKPTQDEIEGWQAKSKEFEDAQTRIVGTQYDKKRVKSGLYTGDSKTRAIEKRTDAIDDQNVQEISNSEVETLESEKEVIDSTIEVVQRTGADNINDKFNADLQHDLKKVYTPEELAEKDISDLKDKSKELEKQINQEKHERRYR